MTSKPENRIRTSGMLAEALCSFRRRNNLSIIRAAEWAGISQETWSRLELEKLTPTKKVLQRLYALGIDIPLAFWPRMGKH